MRDLFESLRQTVRVLLKAPGFTITAILILGFGIGANTAIFSLIDAVLLNALPFPKADRLIHIFQPRANDAFRSEMDYPDYLDIRAANHSFDILSVSYWWYLDLSGQGQAKRLTAVFTSPELFKVTNLPFLLGRPFSILMRCKWITRTMLISRKVSTALSI
jgi:putative ABC transport system permease protein